MSSVVAPVHALLDSVGRSSGLVSASIYDTAQVLRHWPQQVDREASVAWLLAQQDADGGWGTPTMAVARLVPTLASLLALREAPPTAETDRAIAAAESFLTALSAVWPAGIPHDLPVGMELILPVLLNELDQSGGVTFSPAPFRPIVEIGRQRQQLLAQITLRPGSPPLHSYESLQLPADAHLLDGVDSLSHSPSATAAWLQRSSSQKSPAAAASRARAQAYLARAVTGTPAPAAGVYPGVWPMDRFEQCFVLYFFAIAGAFELPAYRQPLVSCAANLARAMRPTGIGLSDHFAVDGDDTAAAIIALLAADLPVRPSWLAHFQAGARYYAYPGERHGSLSLIARAMHAAMLMGQDASPTATYLLSLQQPDGSWANDKWHASWIYATMHAIVALARYGESQSVARATTALLHAQRPDGGWGSVEETAYALLSLTYAYRVCPTFQLIGAISAGRAWLREGLGRLNRLPPLWIGKELYTLPRVIEAAAQAALIAVGMLVPEDNRLEVLC